MKSKRRENVGDDDLWDYDTKKKYLVYGFHGETGLMKSGDR